MPEQNLIEQLKKALNDFKTFLDGKKDIIKPAIAPLDGLTDGKVSKLITTLIKLLNDLKTEVGKLNPSLIPHLDDVTNFSASVKTLVEASKSLLPNETATINDVLTVVDVVSGLGSLTTEVKTAINGLIDGIIADLNFLKS